jgi:hypothetical protein
VSHGSLTLNANGSFAYSPAADYNGSDTFTYKASDGTVFSNVVTVTITVNAVDDAPVVTLSTSDVTGQYSDAIPTVTATATDIDTKGSDITFSSVGLPIDLVLTPNADGTTGTPSVVTPGRRTATISGRLNVPCAGTQPASETACTLIAPYAASIRATSGTMTGAQTLSITVTRENASVVDITPYASFVDGTDGDIDSLNIGLVIDEQADGSVSKTLESGSGLANARPVPVSLTPVGTGSSYNCPTPGANNTSYIGSDPDTAAASCTITNVAVNVYEANATIGGDYFTGSGQGVITVMDPTLGFTTGGGWFNTANGKVNFGFNAKILKSGQVQGSLLTIVKAPSGNYVTKSNSMGALSIAKVTGETYYSATFQGKATYSVPRTDPKLAPFCPADWKCGGYTFTVYVEDQKEPGSGADRFWIQVKDPAGAIVTKVSMSTSAVANASTIVGGNIQVPQPQGK